MAIDPNISGWQSVKSKLKAVIGVSNKVENMTIQRGGTVDSVTFAGDSIKINVQDFPRAKAQGGGGGGVALRQFTGGIASTGGTEPSTAEYITALQTIYTNEGVPPQFGDYITLRASGGSRLVARFWVLNDDQAATNATISFDHTENAVTTTYYALNVTYVPIEQVIDAIQDYFAGADAGQEPDGRDIEPDGSAPFAISVNGLYDTDPDGFLIPAVGNPTLSVNAGTVDATDDINATASGISISTYPFPGGDGVTYVHFYLKVTITLDGPDGTPSGATATIESRTTSTSGVPSVSETSFPTSNTAEKSYTIGVVALARSGDRRFAKITQTFAGDLKAYSNGTGSNTVDSNGVNLAAGLREITLCVNGFPYTCSILTGPLTEVT